MAFDGGLLAEAGVSYAGPGAQARGELAARCSMSVCVMYMAQTHLCGSTSSELAPYTRALSTMVTSPKTSVCVPLRVES